MWWFYLWSCSFVFCVFNLKNIVKGRWRIFRELWSVCFHLLICWVLLASFIFFPVSLAGSRNEYDCVLLNSRHCLKLFQQPTLPKCFFFPFFSPWIKEEHLNSAYHLKVTLDLAGLASQGDTSSSWSGAENRQKLTHKKLTTIHRLNWNILIL